MRADLSLAALLLAFAATPLAAAEGIWDCQRHPIGVEEACYAAAPVGEPATSFVVGRVACLVDEHPVLEWGACVPPVPGTPGNPALPTENCRNPTWDRCLDDITSVLPTEIGP